MRILVVEDDAILLDGLTVGLSLDGFVVDAVMTLQDAREALAGTAYDAAVLDVMLPDGSGLDLLNAEHEGVSRPPFLVLTARNSLSERIDGLNLGAADYLGKPFDLREVAARLRAIKRRSSVCDDVVRHWRDVEIDTNRRTVMRNGEPVSLSRREFAVLEALLDRPGYVLSRRQLEDRVYGWNEDVESNAVEVHVHKLRSKLGRDSIETIRGEGYRIAP